jgi:F0F1-type ATP synthase assembly protein I
MTDKQSPRSTDPGSNAGWAALGTLISGIIVWGGVGALLDWWLDIPNRIGLLVGMILGLAIALYMVLKRFG